MGRCFILGGGNSLDGFDYTRLKNETTIGINFTFKFFETNYLIWSDIDLYPQNLNSQTSLDKKIGIDDLKNTEKWCPEHIACAPYYQTINKFKLAEEFHAHNGFNKGIYGGPNGFYLSGVLGISFAIAKLFDPIYLLGFDCKKVGGKLHHHDLSRDDEDVFKRSLMLYDPFKGFNIFNCSSESLLTHFPKISIDEVLKDGNGNNSNEGPKRETVEVCCVDTLVKP